MLALAFEQGSFAAGGAVIDGQIAQVRAAADNATGQARAKAGAALSSAEDLSLFNVPTAFRIRPRTVGLTLRASF